MTWREQVVVRILLLVARMFVDDPQIALDVKNLATHIGVEGPRERQKALAAAGLVEDDS